jgi:CheY-like chemotaxis protein
MVDLRILCIDDDPFYRDFYKTIFMTRSIPTDEADNMKTGLEKAVTTKPDLILLDIMMPEIDGIFDGYGLLRILRERAETKDTPVIMISALDQTGDIDHAVGLGATSYIPKQELTPDRLLTEAMKLTEKKDRPG